MTEWAVKLYGDPVPQGSMTCVGGGRGARAHQLVPSNRKQLDAWRAHVHAAGLALPAKELAGPVGAEVTFTIARPASVPLRVRAWPCVRCGDVDKLARAILDALDTAGVYQDDSQVCELTTRKVYPDTPGAPDRLDRPGALIRVYTLL